MKKIIFTIISILLFGILLFSGGFAYPEKYKELKVTPEHPFLVDGKWISASELKAGQEFLNAEGRKIKIVEINDIEENVEVYNFEVYKFHNYVASGLIVHNTCPGKVIKAYSSRQNKIVEVEISNDLGTKASVERVFQNKLPNGNEGAKAVVRGDTIEQTYWAGRITDPHHLEIISGLQGGKMPLDKITRLSRTAQEELLSPYYSFELQLNHETQGITIRLSGGTEALRRTGRISTNPVEKARAISVVKEQCELALQKLDYNGGVVFIED